MPQPPAALCLGHPLLDMMADVSEEFLKAHHIVPGSVELAQPDQIGLFTQLLERNRTLEYVPGGAAMNTARVLAWTRPGLPVYYVGCLGTDRFGDMIKTALKAAGVTHLFQEYPGKPTGTCAGLVCHKERSLVAHLGAAVELSLKHMKSNEVMIALDKATVYYSEGFFLNTASSPDNLLLVAEFARARKGKLFCFNLNAPYLCAAFKDRITILMPQVDILFASEVDIMGYACVMWPEEFESFDDGQLTDEKRAKLWDAVRKVGMLPSNTFRGYRLVVITCGAEPTVMWNGKEIVSRAVPFLEASQIKDLNGAGDSFVAGFLAQYLYNNDLLRSADVGHIVAQNCVRHNGAMVGGEPPLLRHQ